MIALAVRSLQKEQRKWGIILGSGAAVALRIILTFFAAQLLLIPVLELVCGLLIAWIAVKFLLEGTAEEDVHDAGNLWEAIKIITIADLIMSTDNVLAMLVHQKGICFCSSLGLAQAYRL